MDCIKTTTHHFMLNQISVRSWTPHSRVVSSICFMRWQYRLWLIAFYHSLNILLIFHPSSESYEVVSLESPVRTEFKLFDVYLCLNSSCSQDFEAQLSFGMLKPNIGYRTKKQPVQILISTSNYKITQCKNLYFHPSTILSSCPLRRPEASSIL